MNTSPESDIALAESPLISFAAASPLSSPKSWWTLAAQSLMRARPSRWMTYDVAAAAAALTLGFSMTPWTTEVTNHIWQLYWAYAIFALASGHISGAYEKVVFLSGARLLLSILGAALLGILGLAVFSSVYLYQPLGRWILLITAISYFVLAFGPRMLARLGTMMYKIRVLFVGDPFEDSDLLDYLKDGHLNHVLVGYCNHGGINGAIGPIEKMPEICRTHHIDDIVVSMPYLRNRKVLDQCFESAQHGAQVMDECSFHEETLEQVPVGQIKEDWFYGAEIGTHKHMDANLKRVLDVFLASLGLILTFPLMLLLWILVPLLSKGPAFYSQIRCGLYGRPFRIYKFRTMAVESEEGKAQWAKKKDPRVTRLGKFLRKSRLDEIPQFWNVLTGDMSFVGPRPERPELVTEIVKSVPFYSFRHCMRPGITGLAQIRYRYGASIEDARVKLQHDLYYIKSFSITLDIRILLRTLTAIMKGSR